MRSAILGTGGHIDHGKTALVRALTGVDTDRLPEERRRGISIDLGFTHLDLEDARVGVVDVPGHEDFIRNMLAGTTGVDALLLVVAADEGVMPQTREHVAIAELLGVERAVVALTKLDLVDDDWLALAREDVADLLADTPFATAPILPCSAVTGEGVERVRAAILDALPAARRRPDDLFRMPVDRAFTVRGTGTVVTGTVWSGALRREEMVRLLPGPLQARVRGLQVHGEDTDVVAPGQRAAVALAAIEVETAPRGTTLVTDAAWAPASIVTARLRVLPRSSWQIETRQRLRVHLGTAEVMARAVLLDAVVLQPGDEGWAQLRLEEPLVARAGDRLVVRSYSPVTTIGGGVVAEPLARKRRRIGPETRAWLEARVGGEPGPAVEALLDEAEGMGVEVGRLPLTIGASPGAVADALADPRLVTIGGRVFRAEAVERTRGRILELVDRYHERWPLRPGPELEELRRSAGDHVASDVVDQAFARALADGELQVQEGRAARAGFAPRLSHEQARLRDRILETLDNAGLAPPDIDTLQDTVGNHSDVGDVLRLLLAEGRLVRLAPDVLITAEVLDSLIRDVQERLGGRSGLGPADFRSVLPVSRKHLIPILEHLDRLGITDRRGEGRSVPAGPG